MAKARLIAAGAAAVAITALAVLRAGQPPRFHLDAQYYVQSALLWPRGEVTFAGSLIGGRDLVVLLWHLAFGVLGRNLEALSAALSFLYAVSCAALSFGIFRLDAGAWRPAVASIVTALVAFPLSIWTMPASDAPGALALAMLWAASVSVTSSRRAVPALPALAGFGLLAGVLLRVRSELAVFVALVVSLTAWCSGGLRRAFAGSVLVVVMLVAGAVAGAMAWSTWVPVERPAGYSWIFPIYRAFDDFGIGANGPASAQLARELGLDPHDDLPFWDAIGHSYAERGPRESDRLVARAGWEAMQRDPATFLRNAIRDTCAELCGDGLPVPRLAFERVDPQTEFASVHDSLQRLDEVRHAASQRFGGDATWPTASLAETRQVALADWQALWAWRARWSLPRSAPLIGGVALLLAALRLRGRFGRALLAPALYGPTVAFFAAASQGPIPRYVEAATLLQFAALAAALPAIIQYRRPGCEPNRCEPGGAAASPATPAGSTGSG